ncbi:hypothetical protein E2562_009287 [Oryza meyeriana var. granulata]|uniref:Uncharacterized protein n=1 Tax=Oryza meyeriana var. granulata TaxID=110450 RepID=A0A6G1EAD6_9ORYZ|nr:hypothetical protein E2562_009287 [Oryza meyeriana var. granulata]
MYRFLRLRGSRAPRAFACPPWVPRVDSASCGASARGPSGCAVVASSIAVVPWNPHWLGSHPGRALLDALGVALGEGRLQHHSPRVVAEYQVLPGQGVDVDMAGADNHSQHHFQLRLPPVVACVHMHLGRVMVVGVEPCLA